MTRQEIMRTWKVDQYGIIRSPGKFEGEVLYAPHYYELMMDGMGETSFSDEHEMEKTVFQITADDTAEFPELGNGKTVELYEDESGFIYCHVNEYE